MSTNLTDEHLRILIAIDEERFSVNRHGRYVIDGEERPNRKSREQLRSRGLISSHFERGVGTWWRVTAKGKNLLDREIRSRVEAARR